MSSSLPDHTRFQKAPRNTQPPANQSAPDSPGTSSFLSLERVVQKYGTRPELLELILSTKVEEDRRRAEEAKLRRKEIDYLLHRHQSDTDSPPAYNPWKSPSPKPQRRSPVSQHSHTSVDDQTDDPRHRDSRLYLPYPGRRPSQTGKSLPYSSPISPSIDYPPHHQAQKHPSLPHTNAPRCPDRLIDPLDPLDSPQHIYTDPTMVDSRRKNSNHNIDMLLSHSPLVQPKHIFPPSDYRRHEPFHPYKSQPSTKQSLQSLEPPVNLETKSHSLLSSGIPPPSPPIESTGFQPQSTTAKQTHQREASPVDTSSKRKRREMQAITTIIETREFPYNDNYLWKNNGNTIHKKTGHKSIYYKCSNSGKGCLVNKTVTFRENGEHLIKYRGQHLSECSRIKRIIDI
ncbi:hypothetical protein CLU79DRAFT_717037 [Phycomyces nitens]|nr:hypothetical protein CLU79DRAFT_717037 [Phycomyces nitens]